MKALGPIVLFLYFTAISDVCSQIKVEEILAQVKVTDARTQKGIRAKIEYSSIPTGSISGKSYDSTFSFSFFGSAKYKVTAEASGYTPKTIIITPDDISPDKKLIRNIKLVPSGETIRLNNLIFSQGKSDIHPESFKELDGIVQMMMENKKMVIQLEGHTDSQGSGDANLKLSQERVEATKKYLVQSGVDKERIRTKAFGGSKPLRNEMTPEARALNRRVEMRILKDR